MKNFPHQFNDPGKLRGALELIVRLGREGQDTSDDGVLGYALAREGIYTFRNLEGDLSTRIAREKQKASGSQGARTAAREVRRTLQTLGWIDRSGKTTLEGEALLTTAPASLEEKAIWRHALWQLELTSDAGTSHPVRVLVQMADREPFQRRVGTELAFVANDDSEAELARVMQLRQLPQEEMQEALKISKVKVDNARKILPPLCTYADLLVADDGGAIAPTETARELAALPPQKKTGPPPEGRRRRQAALPEKKKASEVGAPKEFDEAAWRGLTEEEQLDAIRLRSERTTRHERCVRAVGRAMETFGDLYEHRQSYDLVIRLKDERLLLVEVKTITGDAPEQIRRAVGQLLFYRHYFVGPQWPTHEVVLLVVVDQVVASDLAEFLDNLEIGLFVEANGKLDASNRRAEALADDLGLES